MRRPPIVNEKRLVVISPLQPRLPYAFLMSQQGKARCKLISESKPGAAICPTSSKLTDNCAVAGIAVFHILRLTTQISHRLRKGFEYLSRHPHPVQQD